MFTGCSTTPRPQTTLSEKYRAALEVDTQPPPPGSEAEKAMLKGLTDLFENYTEAYLSENLTQVYAEKVYFRDAFKEFDNHHDVKDYLLEGLHGLRYCRFEFREPIRSGQDFYLPWTMIVSVKRQPEDKEHRSIGITHLRFNAEGKVVFHQDYWDPTDVVYSQIPIAYPLINYVKNKL